MPKIDLASVPEGNRTGYPAPYSQAVAGRYFRRLGPATGIKDFGVNLMRIEPGAWSSQRHWHSSEDEFAVMIEGELVLITDAGETLLKPGDCAGFKAGVPNGHQLINKSPRDALYLEIGTRSPTERGHYPDCDLIFERDAKGMRFLHRSGEPYPEEP